MNLEKPLTFAQQSRLLHCAFHFFVPAVLSGSQIFGGYAPFSLAFAAASGAGWNGLSALVGVLTGSLLLMSFAEAMKYIAISVLIYSAALAFCDTKWYSHPLFTPLSAVLCTASVSFVYLTPTEFFTSEGANVLLELLLVGVCCACYRVVLDTPFPPSGRRALLCHFVLMISFLIAVANIPLGGSFSLGHILAVLLILAAGRLDGMGLGCATGVCAGLAMDSLSGSPFFSVSYSLSAVVAGLRPCSRAVYTLLFLLGTVLSFFWISGDQAVYTLLETALAGIIFLFLPEKWFHKKRSREEAAPPSLSVRLEKQLRAAADGFRDLYDSLTHNAPAPCNDENIALVFDRSADQVCRTCHQRGACWDNDYVSTYTALNDLTALLTERGHLRTTDFPTYFSARCIHLSEFTAAINAEFNALLIRQQYTHQLDSTRQSVKDQYARLSELLNASANHLRHEDEAVPAARIALPFTCEISSSLCPKAGESVCGDTVDSFSGEDGTVYLLLSDGMGCGEAARRESAMAVRLLRQFLCAGIEPHIALKTLNTALTLHYEENGSFTTIDLMVLDPRSGAAVFYKYGAAPSYIRHGTNLRRINGGVLPAGLSSSDRVPDTTVVHLLPGDLVLLASDGFVDSTDDAWLHTFLSRDSDTVLQATATALMSISGRRTGRSDDASLILLRLSSTQDSAPQAV